MQIHMVYKNDSILDPLRHMQPHRSQGRASGFGGGSNKIKKKFYFSFVIISVMIPLFYSIICNNANKYGLQKQHSPLVLIWRNFEGIQDKGRDKMTIEELYSQ